MSIVHETPGLIDIRSFTTFGLHVKPNSNSPIGKFGTGLKYAVATLLRLGCKIRVFIGLVEYEFITVNDKFRDVEVKMCRMRKRSSLLKKWSYESLPFTTEHGKFWEAWQAFRELESNTRDEGGVTLRFESLELVPHPDKTIILVDGDEYQKAYDDRDKIFLPNALTKREGDDRVQVFNEPSKHLYWRGIRVFDLELPSVYTYNILENMDLTEDRTLKYVWEAQSKIAGYVARSKDTKLINAVVSADVEKFFEGRLDFDYAYEAPSDQFKEVIYKKKSRGSYISPRALTYYSKYTPSVVVEKVSLRDRIANLAYEPGLPKEVLELLQYLLKCEIKEPSELDLNDIPF